MKEIKQTDIIVLDSKKLKKSNFFIDYRQTIFKDWDVLEIKVLNRLFSLYSHKTYEEVEKLRQLDYVSISLKDLRQELFISDKNNYKGLILKTLTKISDSGFNVIIDNIPYYTRFIYDIDKTIYSYGKETKNQIIKLNLNKKIFDRISQKNNFTLLNKKVNLLKSKYSLRIYEIIKMKQSQKNTLSNEILTKATYNLKQLNKIFSTNHKYISRFKHHIENRQNDIISKKLFKKNSFDFEFSKTDITFKFNQ